MAGLSVKERLRGLTEDQWQTLIGSGSRSNKLFGKEQKELYELGWWVVKEELPDAFSVVDWDKIINLATEGKYKDRLGELKRSEAMAFILWVYDGLKEINKMEKRELSSIPDGKLIKAGIKRLDILGNFVTLDMLCNGDLTKAEAVKKLKYDLVFSKLLKNHIISEVRREVERADRNDLRRRRKR